MTSNPSNLKRFIAISDIHIFKSKRFHEHEYLIDEFIKIVKQERPDVVVIAGDIIDSKVNISAEQVKLTRKLFKRITDFVPVITILGNHDLNLENKNRISIVEEIIESLKDTTRNSLYFYKHSGIYNQFGINWYVWSCLDDQRNPGKDKNYENLLLTTPVDNSKYKIGLYHGAIKGCFAENGFQLSSGTDVSEFDDCNIVVAGDIHTQQNFRNGEITFCGSFLQTKENEKPYGTFLLYEWDEIKGNFYPEVKILENKFSVVTKKITDLTKSAEFGEVYPEQLLKISYDKKQFTKSEILEYKKELQAKYPDNKIDFKPIVQNRHVISSDVETEENSKQILKLDFKDLLQKFLTKNVETLNVKDVKSDLDSILSLDKLYSQNLGTDKDFEEGDFEIEKVVVNNLYSFGPTTVEIDLSHEGIIGITGKNRSGKSTLLKIIQFVLFNSTPANTTSFKKIINKHNRDKSAFGEVYFSKNKKQYVIRREIIPNKKKDSVAFELTFKEIDNLGLEIQNLTDEKRQNTEMVIQKYCGVEEMFEILSFFSAQKKQIEFVDCKNSKRLELVNKFMGLQEFELKSDSVKNDLRVKNKLYDTELNGFNKNLIVAELQEQKLKNSNTIIEKTASITSKKAELSQIEEQINNWNSNLGKYENIISKKFTPVEQLRETVERKEKEISTLENSKSNKDLEIDVIKDAISFTKNKISDLNVSLENLEVSLVEYEGYENKLLNNVKEIYGVEFQNLDNLFLKQKLEYEKEKAIKESELSRNKKQLEIDICNNCGKEFSEEDKSKVKNKLVELEESVFDLKSFLEEISHKEYGISNCKKEYAAFQKKIREIKDNIQKNKEDISSTQLKFSQFENDIVKIENRYLTLDNQINTIKLEIKTLEESIKESEKFYEERIDALANLSKIKTQLDPAKQKKSEFNSEILSLNSSISQLTQENKNIDQKIFDYQEKLKNLKALEEEVRILSLYKNIVAKDGLPLFILKEKIKDINEEINTIANQIFDFDINFMINEDDGELILDFTYDGDQENCDVSLASGSETFIINLCIKVGLTQISTIPKLKTLVIDEGFGTLDKDNIEKIPVLFTSLLNYYKNLILISHLDEIKDIYTYNINLERKNRYTEII